MRRVALAASLLIAASRADAAIPAFEEVQRAHQPSEAVLLDRHGEVIHELRVDERVRRLPWVPLAKVSPALVEAVLRAEDKRFFEHSGVDWRALGDAAVDTVVRGVPRGASTLSMQVAAMLEPQLRATGQRRTVTQKWDQIRAAGELEKAWTKRRILEAYLNLATFRGELVGIGAAARGLFGKDPSGIDEREGALLAALLRGPNAKPPVVAKRACQLALGGPLSEPAAGAAGAHGLPQGKPRGGFAGAPSCEAFEALATARLTEPPKFEGRPALAPQLARDLLTRDARRVQTTLDAQLQTFAIETLQRQLAQLAHRGVRDAAALVLDNASGEVLAYVGNSGAGSSAPFVDGVRAPRQAGSTLKPFLYATAIEDRVLTAASLLDDAPANLVTPSGLYVPQNYDREFRGLASVRVSLAGSLNVPAVRTLMLVGTERFAGRLREAGFEGVVESGDYYGFSLALGSADVTLWQLTNAYRALANAGQWSRPRVLPAPPGKSAAIIDPGAAYIVSDILADRNARSVTFGLDNPLASRFWTAVKTGTSKDMRDNWCIGYSRRYTVGVWVGNFDGAPMRDVSGVSGAAPAWLDLMNALHRSDSRTPAPVRPADVVVQRVRFVPEIEAERDELFLAGTEVAEVEVKPALPSAARIVYPGEGSIIALDPDIPAAAQRVRFEASVPDATLQWRIVGAAAEAVPDALWQPHPGRFELALIDAQGRELDRVRFEVRGTVGR